MWKTEDGYLWMRRLGLDPGTMETCELMAAASGLPSTVCID